MICLACSSSKLHALLPPPDLAKNLPTGGQLLRNHACCGYHGQTAVVEFLILHLRELCRSCGLQTKWVKVEISGNDIFFEDPQCSRVRGIIFVERGDLWDGYGKNDDRPKKLKRRLS